MFALKVINEKLLSYALPSPLSLAAPLNSPTSVAAEASSQASPPEIQWKSIWKSSWDDFAGMKSGIWNPMVIRNPNVY
jgi:hypothetical protein